jgi:hypothetical protein
MAGIETSLKQIHSIMNDENAVLIYSGEFNQEIVKSMLNYTEGKLESSGIDDLVRKKIFNVMVEQLQNITKHQYTDDAKKVVQPCFVLIEQEDHYNLVTGNPIHIDTIQMVTDRINQVNGLDAEELKALYKQARLNSRISEVGGAGLGFIDVARKTENKLDFGFFDIDSANYKYFTLKTQINKILAE